MQMARKMVKASISGLMELHMRENGKKMRLLDMVFINGQMVVNTWDIGKLI